ncbi:MAG TPA: Na+/H+ antiporter subunit E [Corynebacterium sp.]|nr:Na+/H+ antiporter subunit E [Corynebacterium sp.]
MSAYFSWPFRVLGFWFWYLKEFVFANLSVLRDILTPGHDSTPGIARYECRSVGEGHYTLFAALVTITPGTLVVGAGETTAVGVRVMYVHGMYHDSPGQLRADLYEMEERMLRGLMIRPRFNKGAK